MQSAIRARPLRTAIRINPQSADAQIRVFAHISAPRASIGAIFGGFESARRGATFRSRFRSYLGSPGVNRREIGGVRILASRCTFWARRIGDPTTNPQSANPQSAQSLPLRPAEARSLSLFFAWHHPRFYHCMENQREQRREIHPSRASGSEFDPFVRARYHCGCPCLR